MKLNFNNDAKTAMFMAGAVTKAAVNNNGGMTKKYIMKINKERKTYDVQQIRKIFVTAVNDLKELALAGKKINTLLETAAHYLLLVDNDNINADDASYYYTLGLTSPDITIEDNNIILEDVKIEDLTGLI